jgi:ubiquinone biosynthesis monooxygenase Coq7
MKHRHLSFTDRCLTELDSALRTLMAQPQSAREAPADSEPDKLNDSQRELASRLMRVNHSGEIAAQALYRGQAFVARDEKLRASLLQAANEEHDHLAWCQQRAEQLGGGTSKFAPFWYAGSFLIGMTAGLTGDNLSLGFLAETEKQVAEHLDGHLQKLPATDNHSRAILQKMRTDEIRHGENAVGRGAKPLPRPVRTLMRLASSVMTGISYRV